MKIETCHLIGPALDWAVAKCEDITEMFWDTDEGGLDSYAPSTDWAQGGPIIDRKKIKLLHEASEVYTHNAKWWATTDIDYDDPVHREFGPTPLIAAMRCYVDSVLGDVVDVPDNLTLK